MSKPSKRSILSALSRERLLGLGAAFELSVTARMCRDEVVHRLDFERMPAEHREPHRLHRFLPHDAEQAVRQMSAWDLP